MKDFLITFITFLPMFIYIDCVFKPQRDKWYHWVGFGTVCGICILIWKITL